MRLGFIVVMLALMGGGRKLKKQKKNPWSRERVVGMGEGKWDGGGGWEGATMHSTHWTRVLNFSVDS